MTKANSDSGTILLLASDLMLSSTVSGYAATAQLEFQSALTVEETIAHIARLGNCLLLVDLGLPGLNIANLAHHVPENILATAIAYGPHVHEEKLAAAAGAGFSQVMSRGQFSAQVGRLISQHSFKIN